MLGPTYETISCHNPEDNMNSIRPRTLQIPTDVRLVNVKRIETAQITYNSKNVIPYTAGFIFEVDIFDIKKVHCKCEHFLTVKLALFTKYFNGSLLTKCEKEKCSSH
jgi:hypothetical protein